MLWVNYCTATPNLCDGAPCKHVVVLLPALDVHHFQSDRVSKKAPAIDSNHISKDVRIYPINTVGQQGDAGCKVDPDNRLLKGWV